MTQYIPLQGTIRLFGDGQRPPFIYSQIPRIPHSLSLMKRIGFVAPHITLDDAYHVAVGEGIRDARLYPLSSFGLDARQRHLFEQLFSSHIAPAIQQYLGDTHLWTPCDRKNGLHDVRKLPPFRDCQLHMTCAYPYTVQVPATPPPAYAPSTQGRIRGGYQRRSPMAQ